MMFSVEANEEKLVCYRNRRSESMDQRWRVRNVRIYSTDIDGKDESGGAQVGVDSSKRLGIVAVD